MSSHHQRYPQHSITTNPASSSSNLQYPNDEPSSSSSSSSDLSTSTSSSISAPTTIVEEAELSPPHNKTGIPSVFLSTPNHQPESGEDDSVPYASPNSIGGGTFNEGIELEPYSISKKPSFEHDDKEFSMEKNPYHPDPKGIKVFDSKEAGWQGKKTFRLIGERYFFGIIVAIAVSFTIYILSLPNWTGGTTPSTYYNVKTYSIFMQFALFSFGSFYVTVSLTVAYGMERMKKSKVLYYCIVLNAGFIILYGIFYRYDFHYWYYYLDGIFITSCYAVGEFFFVYKMNLYMQKTETHPPTYDRAKARMVAINYTAPDIVVTIFTVVYMFFMLPVYFSIQSDLLRLGWRLVVHPIYWMIVVIVARQFLTRDISADDIMLNSNIVLHTFFHHQTLGRIFVFTFQGDGVTLTLIGMAVSALEDILIRCVSLKRDEFVCRFFHGPERAKIEIYSQQNLQLRSAIINIQCALEFSGLISAPIFIYLFQKHRQLFHFFDSGHVDSFQLFYLALISIVMDLMSEVLCTFVELRYYKLPHKPTWKWMKDNTWFFAWLVYGSVCMGFLAMLWTCGRTPRALLCLDDNICTCGSIIASGVPDWCSNFNYTVATHM